MVTATAKFNVSVYNPSATQTAGTLGGTSAQAGGTVGAYGYYPPISGPNGPSSALAGPGGVPLGASPIHGLGHMTNIQVPSTVFPNSNFTIVTVFTYAGADVAGYSARITIPGLGIQNNTSQSASVQGGGAATVQNVIATPSVLPYGQIPGTVELVRLGGSLVVDDVQAIMINSPGGVGLGGPNAPPGAPNIPPLTGGGPPPPATGSTVASGSTSTSVSPSSTPTPSGVPPLPTSAPVVPTTPDTPATPTTTVPPVSTPPGVPIPPVATPPVPVPMPVPVAITVAKGSNAGRTTLIATGTGFQPGEGVTVSMHLDRDPGWFRRTGRHWYTSSRGALEKATQEGQVHHTFWTSLPAASNAWFHQSPGVIAGTVKMQGHGSNRHGEKDFSV